MDDTIFALSSGAGRAAIAVVRVSGPSARAVLSQLTGKFPAPRQAQLRTLRGPDGVILDHAVVIFFPSPRSETGEDIAELQLHGSRAVVMAVLGALAAMPGLRPAQPGEFARRALFNGKLDLLGAEALADLIDADTEAQRRQALEGSGSLLRGKAEAWRRLVLRARADIEAAIDFSDEADVAEHLDSLAERNLRALQSEMIAALETARRGECIREGFRVALCGPPNAGKSTLLNALAGRDVAIVSPVAGTTRDLIEVALDLDGLRVRVSDTAGMQESADAIEREGIRRAVAAAAGADLVLWLSPSDAPVPPPADIGVVQVVATKADLGDRGYGGGMAISARDGDGLPELVAYLADAARNAAGGEAVLLTRARHVQMVRDALRCLDEALQNGHAPEICAEGLRQAERFLDRLLGRVDVEDVLGEVFSRFCIGK